MNTYETIYISPAEATQEKVDSTVEKVKSIIAKANGKVITAELWGKRRLAYPIKHNREGYYVYMLFSGPAELLAQMDRHFQVTDTILRGLTIKVDPRHLEKIRAARVSPFESGEPVAPVAPATTAVTEAPAAAPEAVQTAVETPVVPPQESAS